MTQRLKRGLLAIVIVLFGVFTISLFTTPVVRNFWSIATDSPSFFVPKESSVFTFHITAENTGSGDWWLTGEDRNNYYAVDDEVRIYYVFPREKIAACPTFNKFVVSSWCVQLAKPVVY
jgi:hypothetical protein